MKESADGTRRWTAVLFTDMANYSEVTDRIGAEHAYQLMARVVEIAVNSVERFGGKPLSFAGDSILASFGAPEALEDAALMACRASLDFLDQIAEACGKLEHEFGIRPAFRVGISGGMVVVGRLGMTEKMDLNIMGAPVNEAARLEAMAPPGGVLISGAVAGQAAGWLDLEDLGTHNLKGFSAPAEVFRLKGLHDMEARFDAARRRGLVDMVGRQTEAEAL
ncbi:MAG: adenylate/guanylate cyclase domain-containing protein, partial [Planctomycetota bacterium]